MPQIDVVRRKYEYLKTTKSHKYSNIILFDSNSWNYLEIVIQPKINLPNCSETCSTKNV